MDKISQLGKNTLDLITTLGRAALFLWHCITGKSNFSGSFKLFVKQMYNVGVLSLLIIVVSGTFIGMVLSLQGYTILRGFASEQSVGQLVALSLLRELGPVVAALLFAGRAGSALTAEIGNMKATEQLSSLAMIGVDPLKYIIAQFGVRFNGAYRDGEAAIKKQKKEMQLGSVAVDWLGIYEGSYWGNMQASVSFRLDVLNGFIKSLVFAVIVTWLALYQGFYCEPTSEGISRATTKTVVYASLAVLGMDFLLTALMFGDY